MHSYGSKWALIFAGILSIVWGALDINCHGHFSCDRIEEIVKHEVRKRSHLAEYTKQYVDRNYLSDVANVSYADRLWSTEYGDAAKENGVVTCTCTADRKIILDGKVTDPNIRREFSDVASNIVGPRNVDNQIEVLNQDGLDRLQKLLAKDPTNLTMNYQIRDRGTVVLTGDLPNDELGDEISKMVAGLGGVRSVVNRLGEELETSEVLTMHSIYFDFNKWTIRPQSNARIDEAAQYIMDRNVKHPNGHVRVEGHTDSIATDKYNLWLSQKRAEAVVEALVARNVPREILEPVGKGEAELLIRPDDTPEKRAENRRIEFHFE